LFSNLQSCEAGVGDTLSYVSSRLLEKKAFMVSVGSVNYVKNLQADFLKVFYVNRSFWKT